MSRHTQNSQNSTSRNNQNTSTTLTASSRPRPTWVKDSVNLPSNYRVTTESADPRVDFESSNRR